MRTDEEELLIQSIRAGTVRHRDMLIVPATIDQLHRAAKVYNKAYESSLKSGLMTEDTLEMWMTDNNILPKGFFSQRKSISEQIDKLKKDLFRNRRTKSAVKSIKSDLVNTRAKLDDLVSPKRSMFHQTCEYFAQTQKIIYILQNTTFKKKKKYRPSNINNIIEIWQSSIITEDNIRYLARSATWKSIWTNRGFGFDLFKKRKNTDLTINQRNLVTWSRVYDNIQESIDCPNDDVIADDDMLDGWFLIQKDKREKEERERDAESLMGGGKNTKARNAGHVFLPTDMGFDINAMNEGVNSANSIENIVGQQNALQQ
jgi:hypothetical protein